MLKGSLVALITPMHADGSVNYTQARMPLLQSAQPANRQRYLWKNI